MSQVCALECPQEEPSGVDPKDLREALGNFTTGVAIATTIGDGGAPVGVTINSFNSVSLDPPLILWSLANSAPSFGAFRSNPSFAINLLAADQQDTCMQFARPSEDKFRGVGHRTGFGGVPLIDGAAVQFECRSYARYPGGDHEIHVGEVVRISVSDRPPLVFHRGRFKSVVDCVAQPGRG